MGYVWPQQCLTIDANTVLPEVQDLDRPEVGQVGPQCFGTISTNVVVIACVLSTKKRSWWRCLHMFR